jgi:hypothetical protein
LWASSRSPGAGRPTWSGGLSCAEVRWPASLPAMEQDNGRREEGEGDGLMPRSKNSGGLGEKGAKTHSSQGQNKNI